MRLRNRTLKICMLRGFAGDRSGVAALEFALIVPILVTMYFGMTELTRAIDNNRRVTLFTRTIADLTGRTKPSTMAPIFSAATAILQPFDTTTVEIVVSAIGVSTATGNAVGQVCSSVADKVTPRRVNQLAGTGDLPAIPETFKFNGARYIFAEVKMTYKPIVSLSLFQFIFGANGMNMNSKLAWPQRTDEEIVLPGGQPCKFS